MKIPGWDVDWLLRKGCQTNAPTRPAGTQAMRAAARAVWQRVLAHASIELGSKNSEAEAVAAEVWEAVLRSVSRALQRKPDKGSSIADLQGYLIVAFHHRFNRFLKTERKRFGTIELVSSSVNFDSIEAAQDTEWAEGLERTITLKQVVSHMDAWTRRVWQARQLGYSWNEIAKRLGMSQANARMRFQNGLEKTRRSLLSGKKKVEPIEHPSDDSC